MIEIWFSGRFHLPPDGPVRHLGAADQPRVRRQLSRPKTASDVNRRRWAPSVRWSWPLRFGPGEVKDSRRQEFRVCGTRCESCGWTLDKQLWLISSRFSRPKIQS